MRNKKAWIRIVEAFLAVMLITIVLLSIYSSPAKKNNQDIEKTIDAALDEIANNNQMRQEILENKTDNISVFLSERLPKVMNYSVNICNVTDVCNLPSYRPEVYARERIISSVFTEYSPRKIKVFVWEK